MLVLLSGSVAAGKTAVATLLIRDNSYCRISSGDYLRGIASQRGTSPDRIALQNLGDTLDLETDYEWVVTQVAVPALSSSPTMERWLFDAVRKRRQLEHFRRHFASVRHFHLTAPETVLVERYTSRLVAAGGAPNYETAKAEYDRAVLHPNEVEARSLQALADQVFDTSINSAEDIASKIATGG